MEKLATRKIREVCQPIPTASPDLNSRYGVIAVGDSSTHTSLKLKLGKEEVCRLSIPSQVSQRLELYQSSLQDLILAQNIYPLLADAEQEPGQQAVMIVGDVVSGQQILVTLKNNVLTCLGTKPNRPDYNFQRFPLNGDALENFVIGFDQQIGGGLHIHLSQPSAS